MTEHVGISQGRIAVIEFQNFFDPKVIDVKYKDAKDEDMIKGVYSPTTISVLCVNYPERAQYFIPSDFKAIQDKIKEVQKEWPEMSYKEYEELKPKHS